MNPLALRISYEDFDQAAAGNGVALPIGLGLHDCAESSFRRADREQRIGRQNRLGRFGGQFEHRLALFNPHHCVRSDRDTLPDLAVTEAAEVALKKSVCTTTVAAGILACRGAGLPSPAWEMTHPDERQND